MRRLSTSLLIVLLLGVPLAASAQVYKWTDAHGTVHYSDSRPPHGTKYTRINVAADASEPGSKGNADTSATTDNPSTNPSTNPAPAGSAGGRMSDTPANRQKLCKNLTTNINLLKQDRPVVVRGADGKNQLLSKQRKAEELAQEQKQYQAFCGS